MTTLYQQSVPVLVKYLKNLSFMLQKGAKFCDEKEMKHEDLLTYPKFLASRLGAQNIPTFEDDEQTFEQLQARITRTIEVLEGVDPEVINGKENEEIIMESKMGNFRFTGQRYVSEYVIPNFHFHLTSAYCIMRTQGVPLDKPLKNKTHKQFHKNTPNFNFFKMSEPPSTRVQTPEVDSSEVQRTAHVQSLMDRLRAKSPIYNFIMSSAELISTTQGSVTTRLVLNENHLNSSGNLHGAVSATIIDFTTGLAIASWDLRDTTGASVDMHISYLSAARLGDTVEIVSTAEKVGGSVAFTSIRISKVEKDGGLKLVTLGQHTKYVKASQPKTQ
ncbi:unnamed protein product [Fusarium fujikuroi]|uniref:Thioesterase domain-containing protein n=1 Tax=Fusarium fujikuroi TaxID=5127 RepID=A0A9Q9RIG8_FUSFU|nr:unnamed protein product [Fusarium fujikuroi]